MSESRNNQAALTPLEQLVANTCFCKLRKSCEDKDGHECLRERNLYAEFMKQKSTK